MPDPVPPGEAPGVYELRKSGLRFSGGVLSRHAEGALVADHSLADVHEVTLRHARTSDGRAGAVACLLLAGLPAAGLVCWALPEGRTLGGALCAAGTAFFLFGGWASWSARSCFLVLRRRGDAVEYPVAEEMPVAEAFLSELKEHAQKAGLRVRFSVER